MRRDFSVSGRSKLLCGAAALLAAGCAPALRVSIRSATLATAPIDCAVAPTQPGPNQIQLRAMIDPPCDVSDLDFEVKVDEMLLAKGRVERLLAGGVTDHFDTPSFFRPRAGTLLSLEARGRCPDRKALSAADQCRVQ